MSQVSRPRLRVHLSLQDPSILRWVINIPSSKGGEAVAALDVTMPFAPSRWSWRRGRLATILNLNWLWSRLSAPEAHHTPSQWGSLLLYTASPAVCTTSDGACPLCRRPLVAYLGGGQESGNIVRQHRISRVTSLSYLEVLDDILIHFHVSDAASVRWYVQLI